MMRIVFMGTPEYAVPSLEKLIASEHRVVGVFTQPDKPAGRGKHLQASPVKLVAQRYGIPVFQPLKIRKDGVEDLRALKPDLCITAAFGQILSKEVLDIPRLGTVNVHASLLPEYRGSSPIPWCIMHGETMTGITTMLTDEGIDTGDILLQKTCQISMQDTTETLTQKLSVLGADLLMDTIGRIENGSITPVHQDESRKTYFPKITKEMGLLDFSLSSVELFNRIRALNPWPGCYFQMAGTVMKVWAAEAVTTDQPHTAGQIIAPDSVGGISVTTGDGMLRLIQIQAPGGKRMRSTDYLRGHPVLPSQVDTPSE